MIIRTFAFICRLFVFVATIGAFLFGLALSEHNGVVGLLFAAIGFFVSSFFAGGGLTLVTISDQLQELIEIARHEAKRERLHEEHEMEREAQNERATALQAST